MSDVVKVAISGPLTADPTEIARVISRALVAAGWDVHAEGLHFDAVFDCEQRSSVGCVQVSVEEEVE